FLRRGARVFLDLKLHDIPNTVELAASRAGSLGVSYLTIHAAGGADMVKAAMTGAANGAAKNGHQPPIILAVTVLTSMNDLALRETGVVTAPDVQAALLADLAVKSGATGLVCSAREVASVRARVGAGIVLCTPGIRPVGAASNDQSRTETPASAIRAGSDLLVVGRPITAASDITAAAKAIESEIRSELEKR
ncbi:MAG: orotidine-5'-phosphate decarboxylase, partial [Archangium sp.]